MSKQWWEESPQEFADGFTETPGTHHTKTPQAPAGYSTGNSGCKSVVIIALGVAAGLLAVCVLLALYIAVDPVARSQFQQGFSSATCSQASTLGACGK